MGGLSRKQVVRILYANLVLAVSVVSLAALLYLRRLHRFDALILEAGRDYGVDPRLISAVIWVESRFREERVGKAGEIGLMQVTRTAAEEWAAENHDGLFTVLDLFEPRVNIRAGTWYLARGLQRWSDRPDPLPFALAEYNAGRSNALRWSRDGGPDARAFLDAITYPTTRRYIRDILKRYRGRAY
ncbi:MAG TPA: lytic transglycosylase domain-containing protein [Kiritimatiellia bacterium]|nr:lytic transglycosylase domain-containing protein [Kiritimatiellia bacterium]HRZ11972.1 lytic transglycosylase domain-containing protein [Kiritimatiellia bacterium]HSA17222.1 lytic transglycosylase domain-containing protein [Kiritimatiellia bacterium]